MAFKSGENVGPYRILMQLGQGGMATVYKAYHAALDRYVAIKVLHPVFMEDDSFLARFRREAQVVARLDHPNIVPVYDYAEHEGQPYLVMKFIEGETLKARMTRGPLTAQEILAVVEAVGGALGYAHREGILHRDIKPSNVLLAENGSIYLTDFGLARIAESGASTLTSDRILGTPQYISPEQAVGKEELDAGTDIYSFGVMLYEMVVGRVPFSADTPFSIIHDHIYTPLPLPREINPRVPEAVERVLLKALSKERADRFLTVEEMVAAFRQAWDEVLTDPHSPWGVSAQATAPAAVSASTRAVSASQATAAAAVSPPPPAAAPAAPPASPSAATAATAPQEKKLPWGWITAGGLLVVLLVFGGVALGRWMARPTQPVVMEMPSQMPHMPSPPGGQGNPPKTPPPHPAGGEHAAPNMPLNWALPEEVLNSSEEIRQAWESVRANPQDTLAYQRLSDALYDAGYYDLSLEAIARMLQNAPLDEQLLRDLARDLYYKNAWEGTVLCYQVLLQRGAMLAEDERALADASLYIASLFPESQPYFVWDIWYAYDPLLAQTAQARSLYFVDLNEAEALRLLEEVLAQAPDYPPALLVLANIQLEAGNLNEAAALLQQTEGRPLPDWLQADRDYLLAQLEEAQ